MKAHNAKPKTEESVPGFVQPKKITLTRREPFNGSPGADVIIKVDPSLDSLLHLHGASFAPKLSVSMHEEKDDVISRLGAELFFCKPFPTLVTHLLGF